MKDENDNKTVDSSNSQIAIFEKTLFILRVIQETPIASTTEIRDAALKGLSRRTAQRYLKGLEEAGYISRKFSQFHDSRFFLTDKAKQLFGVQG